MGGHPLWRSRYFLLTLHMLSTIFAFRSEQRHMWLLLMLFILGCEGELQRTLVVEDAAKKEVLSLAYSPTGRQIASGWSDNSVKLWNPQTGDLDRNLTGHAHHVTSVAYSPDGGYVLSGSLDNSSRLWNAQTGAPQHVFVGHAGPVESVAYSPDGVHVASSSRDSTVKVWNAQTGELERTLTGHRGSVNSVAYSPSGTHVASGGQDGTIRLWDAKTGRPQGTLTPEVKYPVDHVAYSPDGVHIAFSNMNIQLWNAQTQELQRKLEVSIPFTSPTSATSIAYSPDGRLLANGVDSPLRGSRIFVWDTQTGQLVRQLGWYGREASTIAYSPNGTQIAAGGWPGGISLYNAAPLRLVNHAQTAADGCHTLSKAQCCKFVDGRPQYFGQRCYPATSAHFPSNRKCEPEGWVDAMAPEMKGGCDREPVADGCHTLFRDECCNHTDGRPLYDGEACYPPICNGCESEFGEYDEDYLWRSGPACAPERWIDRNFPGKGVDCPAEPCPCFVVGAPLPRPDLPDVP